MNFSMTVRTNKNTFFTFFSGFIYTRLSAYAKIFFRRVFVMESQRTNVFVVSTNNAFSSIFQNQSIFYSTSFNSVILRQFFPVNLVVCFLVLFKTFFTSISKSKRVGLVLIKRIGRFYDFTILALSSNCWLHIPINM